MNIRYLVSIFAVFAVVLVGFYSFEKLRDFELITSCSSDEIARVINPFDDNISAVVSEGGCSLGSRYRVARIHNGKTESEIILSVLASVEFEVDWKSNSTLVIKGALPDKAPIQKYTYENITIEYIVTKNTNLVN